MSGGTISNVSIISNSSSDFSLNTSGKITTIAVSTINTVPDTVFTGKVTAGSAMIGIPSAFGSNFAYFGHKDLILTGYDYALLQEYVGHTFLNAKSGFTVFIRNGNIDVMTLTNTTATLYKPLDMNANSITFGNSGGDINKINTASWANGGTAQGYGGSLYLGASNSVYFQVPVGFQNTGTALDMNTNNITNVSNINFATGGSISNVNTIRTTALSTNTISTQAIMASNISSYSITAYEGTISNLSSEFCGAYLGYFSTVSADTVSSITVNTDTLVIGGTQYGRLPIQSNATQLSNATTIITTPNTSYLFDDYYNLTNYITISNYGFQNGDFINIVNTGNSGTPATFNVLDGSANPSTLIRYVYPGHAGVIVYSVNQWWPM
jgi:hypothetical protein